MLLGKMKLYFFDLETGYPSRLDEETLDTMLLKKLRRRCSALVAIQASRC